MNGSAAEISSELSDEHGLPRSLEIEQREIRNRDNAGGPAFMNGHSVHVHDMTAPAEHEQDQSARSTPTLLRDAVDKGSELITQEIRLAKQEIGATVRAGVVTVIGGAVAAFALIAFLILAIVTIITAVPLPWAAALGFSVLFLAIAVVAAVVALRQAGGISLLRQTTETIKEDVQWAKQQLTRDEK